MDETKAATKVPAWSVLLIFLRLGLLSFGGPVAHLGYFRDEFVVRRRWLQDEVYADLVALCQFLPGPASSQVGIGIGLSQAGLRGALAAWVGFTLPSALIMILFAYGVGFLGDSAVDSGWLKGLKLAAVGVVAQAVLGMAKKLCPDLLRRALAIIAALVALLWSGVGGQLAALAIAASCGWIFLASSVEDLTHSQLFPINPRQAIISNLMFVGLLLGLPLLVAGSGSQSLALFDSFYRSGSLVFGGGHVVLPLLQAEVVETGWLNKDIFLAGYGAAQALPGPLSTFSAYLGAAIHTGPGRWLGGLLCLIAIFLPSFLLVVGILPFWDRLRRNLGVRRILLGINAGVVGLLTAALIHPVLTSGIQGGLDLVIAAAAFWLLFYRKAPAWLVVLICGVAGAILG